MANSIRKLRAEKALYLYGVSRVSGNGARKPPLRANSVGIDGVSEVKALACGDFLCWVCDIDQVSFARAMEQNSENLEWLALHSVRHQQVVAEVAARMAIVPARFGTVFSGEAALAKNVSGRRAALARVFDRVADADEWGVKVFAEKKAAPVSAMVAKSGKDYLKQKAAQIKQRPERNDPEVRELAAALGRVARASAASGKVSGAQPDLVWQATFLVPRSGRSKWEEILSEFVGRWEGQKRIEINGPWPPYSFASDAE